MFNASRKAIACAAFLAASLGGSMALADAGPGECDGARPQFESPDYQAFGGGQVAVGTQWRFDDAQGVLNVYDLSGQNAAPLGVNWPVALYSHPDWVRSKMGQVFGVALDDMGNIFTAHTAIYFQDTIGSIGGQPGQVYKVNSVTGAATVFATLPNNSDPAIAASAGINESYPGLGNLCFDTTKQMLYVTNFEDGRIYRIDASGSCISTWDHATGVVADCSPEAGDAIGAAPLGERVWAVQSFNGRVYYSIWFNDLTNTNPGFANEVWSVACDATGEFIAGTEQLEVTMPPYLGNPYSSPVSDISFGPQGQMMCAERSMYTDSQSGRFDSSAHQSRALEFVCLPGALWEPSTNIFNVGDPLYGHSSAGGCDYSYASSPDDRVFVTSDAIILAANAVYGIQGLPQSGGGVPNSLLIDMDADVLDFDDKTGLGSVEISCPTIQDDRCAIISNEVIECETDGSGNYTITFDLTNNSGQDVKHLLVLPDPGYTVVPSGLITLPNLLLNGQTTQVTLTFNGGQPGDILCFVLSLNTVDFEECCAIEHCFEVPDCDCAKVSNIVAEPLCDGTNCFTMTFDVTNLTPIPIFYSFFSPVSPAGITIDTGNNDPSRWDYSPVLPLGTESVSLTICGAQPGEEVCFLMTMHDAALGECCSIKVTVVVPDCDPVGLCPADCNGDGELNFFDVSMFLTEFNAQDPRADLNNDGSWNFFDLSLFLMSYNAGCP